MQGLKRETDEAAAQVRAMELARLDELTLAVWPAARGGDLSAVACVLRIMERRARLLSLDAPMLVAPTSPPGPARAEATGLTMDVFMAILALWQAQPSSAD
jgi:hypothetical protein